MDTLGSYEPEQQVILEHIRFAVTRVLHNWKHPMDERDDLVQDVFARYLAQPSTRAIVSREGNKKTFIRDIFYREAQRVLSKQVADNAVTAATIAYPSESVKDWLAGRSTNKFLGKMIQIGLDGLSDISREAVRQRYELGKVPPQGTQQTRLRDAIRALTVLVNEAFAKAQDDDPKWKRPASVQAGVRRQTGGYKDNTASLAFNLIRSGDDEIGLEDGGTTTMRQLFEEQTLPIGVGTGGSRVEWLDLFEGEINDRTDMYRAAVLPELYPDEKPMMLENWDKQDLEAYCGGIHTVGYRRLKAVK